MRAWAVVEVDPSWETDSESAPAPAEAPQLSLRSWINLVPRWAWVILVSVLIVVTESVAARLATPADSWARTAWSLSQMAIGFIAVVGCHIFNFLVLAAEDAEIGLLDLLLKPLRLWIRAIQNLPTRIWVADSAACGLVAVVLSILVIGGIPYDRLWDWGGKQPPKQDLMAAVMRQMQNMDDGKQADDLEKSVTDFAGDKGDGQKDKPKADPPKPQQNADCVILGYVLDRDGRLSTLLLGTAAGGQLVYAGNVAPKLSDDELKALAESLATIQAKKPIIKIEAEATWVQPRYTCRVGFTQRTKGGGLRDIEWDKMLGTIRKR